MLPGPSQRLPIVPGFPVPAGNDCVPGNDCAQYPCGFNRSRGRSFPKAAGNDWSQYPCAFPGSRVFSLTERVSIGNAHLPRIDWTTLKCHAISTPLQSEQCSSAGTLTGYCCSLTRFKRAGRLGFTWTRPTLADAFRTNFTEALLWQLRLETDSRKQRQWHALWQGVLRPGTS